MANWYQVCNIWNGYILNNKSLYSYPEYDSFKYPIPTSGSTSWLNTNVGKIINNYPDCLECHQMALVNQNLVPAPTSPKSCPTLKRAEEETLETVGNVGFYGSDGCFYPYNYNPYIYTSHSTGTLLNNLIQNFENLNIGASHQKNLEPEPNKCLVMQQPQNNFKIQKPYFSLKQSLSSNYPRMNQEAFHKVENIYKKFHPSPFPSFRPLLLGLRASKYAPGIDTVWRRHFDMLFGSFQPHRWSFAPTDTPLLDWNIFKDMAKVRFSCHTCQHGWTSMHGVVVFYYRFDPSYGKGEVRFALTGQKCIECQNQHFETPMWYPEEAQKVMTNLFYQIASNIYRLKTPPPIKDRRLGRPLKKHVASNCQGCDLGLCKPPSSLNSEQSKPSCQPNSSNSSPNNVANVSIDRS